MQGEIDKSIFIVRCFNTPTSVINKLIGLTIGEIMGPLNNSVNTLDLNDRNRSVLLSDVQFPRSPGLFDKTDGRLSPSENLVLRIMRSRWDSLLRLLGSLGGVLISFLSYLQVGWDISRNTYTSFLVAVHLQEMLTLYLFTTRNIHEPFSGSSEKY